MHTHVSSHAYAQAYKTHLNTHPFVKGLTKTQLGHQQKICDKIKVRTLYVCLFMCVCVHPPTLTHSYSLSNSGKISNKCLIQVHVKGVCVCV